MPRVRTNNFNGLLTASLSSGASSMSSAALNGFPAISAPDYSVLVLEAGTAQEEIVYLMAHGQEPPATGPQAPTTSTAASTLPLGTYEFSVTYVTADGETTASGPSAPVTTTSGNASISASFGNANFPVPAGVTSVKFYLTKGPGGATLGFVGSATPSGGVASLTISAQGNGVNAPTTNATTASTSGTIWRAREGSPAGAHNGGAIWAHGPTHRDYDRANRSISTFEPEGWDDAIVQGLYNSGTKPFVFGALGSSWIEGGPNVADNMSEPYAMLIGSGLQTTYGRYGEAYFPGLSTAWMSTFKGTPPWNLNPSGSGNPNAWTGAGPVLAPRWDLATGGPDLATFTSPKVCGSMELVVWDTSGSSGAVITMNVDGGTSFTFTLSGAEKMVRIQHASLQNLNASQTHTLHITGNTLVSSLGSFIPICAITYPGATGGGSSGVGVVYCGWSGMTLGQMARLDLTHPQYKLELWAGPTVTGVPPYSTLGFGFPFNLDWCLFSCPNDCLGVQNYLTQGNTPTAQLPAIGPDMYDHGLTRLVQAIRAGKNDLAAITFELLNGPDSLMSDVTSTLTGFNAKHYFQAIYAIAREYRCSVYSPLDDWGERANSRGMTPATDPHPWPAGHNRIYQIVQGFLP